jgi:hypothetical protein
LAFVSRRQLLDHAAAHDSGVPAFEINNMKQRLAPVIADAARQTIAA